MTPQEKLEHQVSVLRQAEAIFAEYDDRHLVYVVQCYIGVLEAKISKNEDIGPGGVSGGASTIG